MYSEQPNAFLEAVFMNSVKEKEAVAEKFCGFSSPFIQPVLNYGLSAQQGKVKLAECQHKQLCLAGEAQSSLMVEFGLNFKYRI